LAAFSAASIAAASQAQEQGDFSAGIGFSTFGPSLAVEFDAAPNFGVRGILMGGFSVSDEFQEEGYSIDASIDLGGLALLADYYPFAGTWRVSGGVFFSNTNVAADFVADSVADPDFSGELALKNETAPMITTGFSRPITDSWSISSDLGVIISPIEASSTDADPDVQDEVGILNDAFDDVPVYPYASTAIIFRF